MSGRDEAVAPVSAGDPAAPLTGAAIDAGPAAEAAPLVGDGLSHEELKRRASAGISIVASRGVAIVILSTVGSVILARLLVPRDFGEVAIGMSVVLFTSLVADGGLGAGLIRRPEPPLPEELEALTGFQLVVAAAVAVATAAVAPFFGKIGWITAVMVASMPVTVLQFPGRILLERSLSYRALARVEVVQVLAYQVWAVALVAAGFGVWGLATATIAMRVVAAVLMAQVSPVGAPRARLSWRQIRPLLGFGAKFQANSATWLVREQGLNLSLAAISGVAALGLLGLARRLLEIPYLLLGTLFRVSFPTMSQLVARREDTTRLIERSVGMVAVGSGLILTSLAGSARGLVPGVFGGHWREAAGIVPLACLGLGIGGSISVATEGYLYAVEDAAAVLRSSIAQTSAIFVVTLPLLPWLGVRAVGVGMLASFLTEALTLARSTWRWLPVRLFRPLLAPTVAGIVAGGGAWYAVGMGGNELVSGIAGGIGSALVFLVLLAVLDRRVVLETFRFAVKSLRAAASPEAKQAA